MMQTQSSYTYQKTHKKFSKKVPADDIKQIPTHFLIKLLELVLHGNIFEFDDQLYRQIIGTAMGTRVAPTYACLFMGWLEEKILKTWKGTKPYLWKRYIDDIFFIWRGSEAELVTLSNI